MRWQRNPSLFRATDDKEARTCCASVRLQSTKSRRGIGRQVGRGWARQHPQATESGEPPDRPSPAELAGKTRNTRRQPQTNGIRPREEKFETGSNGGNSVVSPETSRKQVATAMVRPEFEEAALGVLGRARRLTRSPRSRSSYSPRCWPAKPGRQGCRASRFGGGCP